MFQFDYTDEELSRLDNETLKSLFFKLRSFIFEKMRKNEKSRAVEIYLCYVSRELQKRNDAFNKFII
jgi:hypothetical protein